MPSLIGTSLGAEITMTTSNCGFETDDKRKRRKSANTLEPNKSNPSTESQSQATSSRNHLFREAPHNSRTKTLENIETSEETNATSELASEDVIMTDTIAEFKKKGFIKLPSLRQGLPESHRTIEPEGNIDRPYYNKWSHCEGFVAWWDNRTGKGMIIDNHLHLEHKVELNDIKWSNYGALVPGSMVEYEYTDDGTSKGISKFWVVSGCEYVL